MTGRRRGAMGLHRRELLGSLLGICGLAFAAPARPSAETEPLPEVHPVLKRYATLASYADSGLVETAYQWPGSPALIERHTFETAFRAPRDFFFRFDADPASGGDAYVIWCDGGPFQSWWKATGVHEVHDGGRGANAFLNGAYPTKDAANLVAPHLFPQARLAGPTSRLIDPREAGEEELAGRVCRKLVASGRETGVVTSERRPISIWIDGETRLIRKALLEEHEGTPPGLVDRTTFLIEPVAEPEIADDRFAFAPPA